MADVEAAYNALQEIERTSSLKIDGVVIAECDANGKISLGKVTEHSTKTGLKWGAVGGVVLGVIFPPSILASAVGFGAFGAAIGKAHNVIARKGLADELAGVMKPNTAGIVALVEDTAVVAIRRGTREGRQHRREGDRRADRGRDRPRGCPGEGVAQQLSRRAEPERRGRTPPDARPRSSPGGASVHGRRPSATFARSCIWALVGGWPPRLEMSVIPKKSVPLRT